MKEVAFSTLTFPRWHGPPDPLVDRRQFADDLSGKKIGVIAAPATSAR
jgi:hypothetical protein